MAASPRPNVQRCFYAIGIFCLAVAVVVVGRTVLAPLALACLLAFVLTPIVRYLERLGWSRGIAVAGVISLISVIAIGLAGALVTQLTQLAAELPKHSQEVESKLVRLRANAAFVPEGVWESVEGVTGLSTSDGEAEAAEAADGEARVPFFDRLFGERYLIIQQPEASPWVQVLPLLIVPAIEPTATVLIAVVLAIFMTAKRDDLRNRLLALLGRARLSQTTHLLSDSSFRLSRYLLGLVTVNLGFSIVFTIGLMLIGVPYAALWGCVSFFFRFIPWLGSAISMLLPLALSIATLPGWFPPVAVTALYLLLEFTTGNFVEPWLYGRSVGMNILAIFVAIMFWTWAWGLVGMLLATPLTLTLVTLGRHFPCFGWLSLLLGNTHPLPIHIAYYQRILAGDTVELDSMTKAVQKNSGHAYAMQSLILASLKHADRELRRGALSRSEYARVNEVAGQIAEHLIYRAEHGLDGEDAADTELRFDQANGEQWPAGRLHVASFSLGDERGLQMIRVLLADRPMLEASIRHNSLSVAAAKKLVRSNVEVVLLSVADRRGREMIESACRLLRRCGYQGWIAAGWWRLSPMQDRCRRQLKAAGADYITHRAHSMSRMIDFAVANHEPNRIETETAEEVESENDFVNAEFSGT